MNSEKTKKTKITIKNWKNSTIAIIAGIVISSITITYGVINALIIEHYKLENQRLEKLLDQQKTLENFNDITIGLKNILEIQNKIIDSLKEKSKINTVTQIKSYRSKDIISKIDKSIKFAKSIRFLDPTDNKTLEKYYLWKSQSASMIKSIDSELKTNYGKNFNNLTNLSRSDYQRLGNKIADGILILEAIKNIL